MGWLGQGPCEGDPGRESQNALLVDQLCFRIGLQQGQGCWEKNIPVHIGRQSKAVSRGHTAQRQDHNVGVVGFRTTLFLILMPQSPDALLGVPRPLQ